MVFILEWAAYILFYVLFAVVGGQKPPHQLAVSLWPLVLLYGLGCTLVKWSERATRVTNGTGIALLSIIMIALVV
jgi:Sec-independent protein secretion pathway component TatC